VKADPYKNVRDHERVVVRTFVNFEEFRPTTYQKLSGYSFVSDELGKIYQAAVDLWLNGGVKLPKIVERTGLAYSKFLELIEGKDQSHYTAVDAIHAVDALLEFEEKRRFLYLAEEIRNGVATRDWGTAKVKIEGALTDALIFSKKAEEPIGGKELADYAVSRLTTRKENKRRTPGIETGFPQLDEITRGLHVGVSVLMAGTGKGKSALALQMARVITSTLGPGLYISEEMELAQTVDRLVSQDSGIPQYQVASGYYNDEGEWEKILRTLVKLQKTPLYLTRNDEVSIDEICSLLFRFKRQHDLKFAVVDYLGEIPAEFLPYEKEYQMLGRYMDRLRIVAKRLRLPVLVLAQLQRKGATARTQDTDLVAGSHLVVRKAGLVMNLKEIDPDPDGTRVYELKVTKNRNGPVGGIVLFRFQGETLTFQETGLA